MEVGIEDSKLNKIAASPSQLIRKYGPDNGKKIHGRLQSLRMAPTLEDMKGLPGGIHELSNNRAGRCSIELSNGMRIILRPMEDPPPRKPDGGLDRKEITAIIVEGIIDYHGKNIR